jgi:hypothetical protein
LVYFTALWSVLRSFGIHILWSFGKFWYIFSPFWYVVQRKIWQPCLHLLHYWYCSRSGAIYLFRNYCCRVHTYVYLCVMKHASFLIHRYLFCHLLVKKPCNIKLFFFYFKFNIIFYVLLAHYVLKLLIDKSFSLYEQNFKKSSL